VAPAGIDSVAFKKAEARISFGGESLAKTMPTFVRSAPAVPFAE
jgi:hypothetical protein